jgi:hypothetical protein
MPSEAQQEFVSPDALARRHEMQNPPVRGMLLTAAWIVGVTVACAVMIWFGMVALTRSRPMDKSIVLRGIIVASNAAPLERFPQPHLQLSPPADMSAFRAREEEALTNYAWIDRTNGIVRIPIERAMDLLLERGLPVRASNAPARTGKSSYELLQERAQERDF